MPPRRAIRSFKTRRRMDAASAVRSPHAMINGSQEAVRMGLLDTIHSPADVKKLSPDELTQLAVEIRNRIVEAVSTNGGHLASNLGVVELTIALHSVFDFGPHPAGPDRLLWDV